jgi:hypothetical protein
MPRSLAREAAPDTARFVNLRVKPYYRCLRVAT